LIRYFYNYLLTYLLTLLTLSDRSTCRCDKSCRFLSWALERHSRQVTSRHTTCRGLVTGSQVPSRHVACSPPRLNCRTVALDTALGNGSWIMNSVMIDRASQIQT